MREQKFCSGATFIEVSLTISIFLAMVMGFLWLGLAMNARSALTLSLGEALRYGVTRGVFSPYMKGLPANSLALKIELYRDNFGNLPTAPAMKPLDKLLYRMGKSDTETPDDFDQAILDKEVLGDVFPGISLRKDSFPATYIRALVSMHQYMRTRVGLSFLKYPCHDRSNCLRCRFMNPGFDADGNCVEPLADDGSCPVAIDSPWKLSSQDIPAEKIVMQCSYNPDFGLFTDAMHLLGGKGMPSFIRTLSVSHIGDY